MRVCGEAGQVLVQVPVNPNGGTLEDPSVVDPKERERLFGQHDHVRFYGLDVVDRLDEAGFDVSTFDVAKEISVSEQEQFGLAPDQMIFVCKPRGKGAAHQQRQAE